MAGVSESVAGADDGADRAARGTGRAQGVHGPAMVLLGDGALRRADRDGRDTTAGVAGKPLGGAAGEDADGPGSGARARGVSTRCL